jgi:hypothetical protein
LRVDDPPGLEDEDSMFCGDDRIDEVENTLEIILTKADTE